MSNVINYKNYKGFWNDFFRGDLINELCTNAIREEELTGLFETSTKFLDCHATKKKKVTRANDVPFSTKENNKEIMTRPKW